MEENTRLSDDYHEDSREYSPPNSKRVKLDDGCNNNLNSTLNSESKNGRRWSYRGDTSLVEPEVLVDLGVSMLDDDASSESLKKSSSQDGVISLSESSSECSRQPTENGSTALDDKDKIYGSSFEKIGLERLDQDPYHTEDPAVYSSTGNESGYSSRIDNEVFADKQNYSKNDSSNFSLNTSDADHYYLYRRKKKASIVGEDEFNKLSDEMVLMILKWLPKKCLVRSMLVCKRWCQIARDEALWTRLDLGSKVLAGGTLGHILPRGVQILRLAQAELHNPLFNPGSLVLCDDYFTKLQYLDLSMAVITADSLTELLNKCRLLKKLSLERCELNEPSCQAISKNTEITTLNLTMCEGIDLEAVKHLMKLKNLNALNISWCSLTSESVSSLCKLLPPSVTRLNLAGCRKTITDDDVKILTDSCPDLVELDLSDCTLLTIISVQSILNLTQLEHLSLSRCYSISPSSYLRLAFMPSLSFLDVFGLMSEPMFKNLQNNGSGTEINKFLYSSIARPTVGVRRTSIWGLRVRD
ncbi:S-phase kinase-associated protein 2 isoform X1 [Microplitis demolitor]|uniref:S-phase kinase-associated protein 2 isoform X1 n=1 Tax=Microplitis demolitor TaxID=69319 RepID=UPI0004CCC986|nr:S-phase kinase-associated protein 2 isoform X1 [Microplitis demolitor]